MSAPDSALVLRIIAAPADAAITRTRSFGDKAGRAAAIVTMGMLLVMAGETQAALPPYYQRAREIEAIVNNADVANKLGKAPIDQIDRPADDLYRVRSGSCTLEVRIVDDAGNKEPGWAGPRRFRLDVGKPVCR